MRKTFAHKTLNINHLEGIDKKLIDANGRFNVGYVLEKMDLTAAESAMKFAGTSQIVTRYIEMDVSGTLSIEGDLYINAMVNSARKSSMEVGITLESFIDGKFKRTASGYFAFVALATDGKPVEQLPKINIEDEEYKILFELSEERRKQRILDLSELEKISGENHETEWKIPEIAQPETSNIHGKVFGGYIMHRAYAYAQGVTHFLLSQNPNFNSVGLAAINGISFIKPIDIGSNVIYRVKPYFTSYHTLVVGVSLSNNGLDHIDQKEQKTNECFFTLVGLDKEDKPIELNYPKLKSEFGRKIYEFGKERRGKIIPCTHSLAYH